MTWRFDYTLRETRIGEVTSSDVLVTGTYVRSMNDLELTDDDGEMRPGSVSGDSLTSTFAGHPLVAVR